MRLDIRGMGRARGSRGGAPQVACRWRGVGLSLLLLSLLMPAPFPSPTPAQAAVGIRWGFYVTYNPNSLESLQAHADQLNYVSSWFYNVDGNGVVSGTAQGVVNDLLRAKGIKNLPLVKNRNGYQNFHSVLLDPVKRNAVIAQLRNLVLQNGYDGITIDFEAITASDQPLVTAFMEFLYRDFKANNKLVAMTLPAKTADVATGWAGPFSYRDLRPWADYFLVMAYDQHYATGDAGPIAPFPWLNDVANYAASTLGSDKIIWGIGVYGYDWNTSYYPRQPAQPRTWNETQSIAAAYNNGDGFAYDYTNQSPSLVYIQNNERHEIWYENKQSFEAKAGLVQQHNFPGFAIWRLGQEDPGIWQSISGIRNPCTPVTGFPNTRERVYFPQTGHSLGGAFLQYWQSHGGLALYGYPLTEEFKEASATDGKVYTVQYFERNRFELHPENAGTRYLVEMGLLGLQYTAHRQFTLSEPFPNTAGQRFFAETGHSLGGGFYQFWTAKGGLAQFGYPISQELLERSPTNGNFYTVQYFERARFEWHPEYAHTANEFQLGLLGVWALQLRGCAP